MSNTVTEIKNELQTILNNSTWWQRFVGSQFVAYLALFIAQVVARSSQAAERHLQDSFLATAIRRAAILAAAEGRGYVGSKARPSIGSVKVENNTDIRIAAPSNTQFVAANQVSYLVTDAIDLNPLESIIAPLYQLEIVELEHIVTEESSWQSIVIPSEYTEQVHKILVYVDGDEWQPSYKFRNTSPNSKVYMEYYKSTDQYGIRFGNGLNGVIPALGAVITIELWLTEGDTLLLDGQELELVENQDVSVDVADLTVKTDTQIAGGAGPEDIEDIRNGALYFENYDEQIVWDGDYKAYIKKSMSNILWVSVWGEQEQEKLTGVKDLDNINSIFISAYAANVDEDLLGQQIIALFDNREGYNEKYKTVYRKDAPFTVSVTGYVYDSSNPQDAEVAVIDKLTSVFGKDVKDKGEIKDKNIWAAIESLADGAGIDAFKVEISGVLEDIPIDTYQYLDIDSSSVSFAYRG